MIREADHLNATALTVSEALDAAERLAGDVVRLTETQTVVPSDDLRFLALRLRQLTRGVRQAYVSQTVGEEAR